jgi:RNA-binding motif protein, X-linked 2
MNSIRQTQLLNKRELESAVPPSASWHADYRDTAYIYVGGFPFDLSEGDLVTIFSQYGNPTHLNLIRDRETGKSKGFAFLKYEDQRSCDLAVDNLGGAEVLGRVLRVDHTRYKKKEGEDEETFRVDRLEGEGSDAEGQELINGNGKRGSDTDEAEDGRRKKQKKRALIKEEEELEELMRIREGGEEDPMRQYLIEEKKEEVGKALARIEKKEKHRHKHHGDRHRNGEGDKEHRSHRNRHDEDEKRGHRCRGLEDHDRHHRRRRRDEEDKARSSRHHRRRRSSDDELSSPRNLGRRNRDAERSRSRSQSRQQRPATSNHNLSSRRRDPRYDRKPSRSLSRSARRERR